MEWYDEWLLSAMCSLDNRRCATGSWGDRIIASDGSWPDTIKVVGIERQFFAGLRFAAN